jgi:hypothetical protein
MAKVLSIQGEQQEQVQETLWATDDDVAGFVEGADDKHLICRERGRHDWRSIRQEGRGLVFTGTTLDDFPERRQLCPDCKAVERVEVWDVKYVKGGKDRGKVSRCELLSVSFRYVDDGYQNKTGHGRMKPKQIKAAVGTVALRGMSYREVMAQARKAQEERKKLIAEARRRQLALVAETA